MIFETNPKKCTCQEIEVNLAYRVFLELAIKDRHGMNSTKLIKKALNSGTIEEI